MDGLKYWRTTVFAIVLLALPLLAVGEGHHPQDNSVIGNGRQFIKQEYSQMFHGKHYPVYKDASGVEAYFEGLIVLELRPIQDYDAAIAWSVYADEMDTYHDLGITLLSFEDPLKAETAYYKLVDSLDPNILYIEMALIERPIW